MSSFAIIDPLYNGLFKYIHMNPIIKSSVNKVYKVLPKNHALTYLRFLLKNCSITYTNVESIIKILFSCEIQHYSFEQTFVIVEAIQSVINQFTYYKEGLKIKNISNNQLIIKQSDDDAVNSVFDFNFLVKDGNYNESGS